MIANGPLTFIMQWRRVSLELLFPSGPDTGWECPMQQEDPVLCPFSASKELGALEKHLPPSVGLSSCAPL